MIESEYSKKPLVTIITVIYNIVKANRVEMLKQCIESVHNQTYKNIEHIIVDGCSDDNSTDLIKEYENMGWVKIHVEKDEGIVDAFNHGTMIANGAYVAFLNSDVYFFDPEGIERAVNALLQSGADYSYSLALNESTKNVIKTNYYSAFSNIPYYQLSMLVKKEILQKHPFSLDFPIAADYDFFLKLITEKYKPVFVKKPYCQYRPGGASSNAAITAWDATEVLYKHINKFCSISRSACNKMWQKDVLPLNVLLKLFYIAGFSFGMNALLYYVKKHIKKWLIQLRTKKGKRILRILGVELINDEKIITSKKILFVTSKSSYKKINSKLKQIKKHLYWDIKTCHRRKIFNKLPLKKSDIVIADANFKYKDDIKDKFIENSPITCFVYFLYLYLKFNSDSLLNKDFTIISDDCWGGFIYKYCNLEYSSPFVWNALSDKNFVKFCQNFKENINSPLTIKSDADGDNPPIGTVNGIDIALMHYKTFNDAKIKWDRRKERINYNNLYFKMTSNDPDVCKDFLKLPFKNKVLFTSLDIDDRCVVKIKHNEDSNMEYRQYVIFNYYKYFNLIKWLNTGIREKFNND